MSPIHGLTDRGLAFAQIGTIRKGAPKDPTKNKPGSDLKYFRVVFDEAEKESERKFLETYGPEPKLLNVIFPFNDLEQCAQFWLEAYTAGRMVARSDGSIYQYKVNPQTGEVLVKNGVTVKTGQPWGYDANIPEGFYVNRSTGKEEQIYCKGVGRIRVVIPELKRYAYLLLLTTSINDIANLSEQLQGIWESNGHRIAGIPLIVQRKPRQVSCPGPNDKAKRVHREKWLLSIEPNPLWVEAKLIAMNKEAFQLDPPQMRLLHAGPPQSIQTDEDWTRAAPSEDFGSQGDDDDEPIDGEVKDISPAASTTPPGASTTPPVAATTPPAPTTTPPPAAKTPKTSTTNKPKNEPVPVKPTRPYAPEYLMKILQEHATKEHAGKTAGMNQRALAASMIERCFVGMDHTDKIQHSILAYLTGHASPNDVPDPYVLALLEWLKPIQDSGGDYTPDFMAIREAGPLWTEAQKAAGQLELIPAVDPEAGEYNSMFN